jgi:hypothetical protein
MAARHSSRRVRFKAILGFRGYYVGSDGSVWSTWRRHYRKGASRVGVAYLPDGPWRQLRQTVISEYGYRDVQLRRDGRPHHALVHRLVLLAFAGPPPQKGMEAAHENGNAADNRLGNLSWKTKKANQADRLRHGTDCRGEKHGSHKLTDDAVGQLLEGWAAGQTKTQLARRFGVDRRTVGRIIEGESWCHVARPKTRLSYGQSLSSPTTMSPDLFTPTA